MPNPFDQFDKAANPFDQFDRHETSTATDIARAPGGLVRGFVQGLGDIGRAEQEGDIGRGLGNLAGMPQQPLIPTGAEYAEKAAQGLGLKHPEGEAGKALERGFEFAGNPMSYVLGPESLMMKFLGALGAGAGSKAAESLVGGSTDPEVAKWAPAASIGGAFAGGMVPSGAMKAITPNAASPLHMQDVNALKQYGIPLTAGDITGNKTLRAAESELSPYVNEAQRKAFQQAAFDTVNEQIGERHVTGAGGPLDTVKQRVGGQFNALQNRNTAAVDNEALTEFGNIKQKYTGVPGSYDEETERAVTAQLDRVGKIYQQNGGRIPGNQYQRLRSDINDIAMSADKSKSRAMHEITSALDNNMERTIAANNPNDLGAFRQAREDWKKYLTLRRWGNSKELTPDALRQSARNVYGEDAYNIGKTPFSKLADAGSRSIPAYQTSETTRRGVAEGWTKPVAGLAGYLAGTHYGNPELGVLSGLAAEQAGQIVGRPLVRRALMSSPIQGYLGNQIIPQSMQESVPLSVRLARAIAQTQGQ